MRSTIFITVKYCDYDIPLDLSVPVSNLRIQVARKVVAAIIDNRFDDFAALSQSGGWTPEQVRARFDLAVKAFQKEKLTRIVSEYQLGAISYFGLAVSPKSSTRFGTTVVRVGEHYAGAAQALENAAVQNVAFLDRARPQQPEAFAPVRTVAFAFEQEVVPQLAAGSEAKDTGPAVTIRYALRKCDIDLLEATDETLDVFGAAAPALRFLRGAYQELKRGDAKRFWEALSPQERVLADKWLALIGGPAGLEEFRTKVFTEKRIRGVIDAGAAWIVISQGDQGPYGGPFNFPEYESVRWNEDRKQFEIVNRAAHANIEALLQDADFQKGLQKQLTFTPAKQP